MNVLILRSNPVDPDSRVEKLASELISQSHAVEILAWNRDSKHKLKQNTIVIDQKEFVIYRYGRVGTYGGGIKKNLIPLIIFQFQIFKWIKKNKKKYNVVHACDFDTALAAMYACKIFRIKLIYDIFDYYIDAFRVPRILSRLIKLLDDKVAKFASGLVICNESRIDQVKHINHKNLYVIHNTPKCVAVNINQDLYKNNNQLTQIAYFGILGDGRLLLELLEIVSSDQRLFLHIGGFGYLEPIIKKYSEEYPNIHYYGKVSYGQVIQYEYMCDIITAIYDPSIKNHRYASPNKFYEALCLGKPLIVVKDTGIDKIVSQYAIGSLIDFNKESLKEGINKLIQMRYNWSKISLIEKGLYEEKYSWSIMSKRIKELYNSLE